MSRGFRDADETQAASEQATVQAIHQILEEDREQAEHSETLRAQGKSGVCEDCGRDIGAERLEALPKSTRCVSCQAEWEQANR